MRSSVTSARPLRTDLGRAALVSLALTSLAFAGLGCATSMGSASSGERVVVAVDAAPARASSSEVVVTDSIPPPAPAEATGGRRRLSQTVTLGQGASEPIYARPEPQQGTGSNAQGVTVNNNVTVVNQTPAVYGGYGYGGYGYGTGYGVSGVRDGRSTGLGHGGSGPSRGAWAPNGWEGAQRTAAPGRTPGVGGNWAPAPSFGPAPMR
jgi:hypothetical protein